MRVQVGRSIPVEEVGEAGNSSCTVSRPLQFQHYFYLLGRRGVFNGESVSKVRKSSFCLFFKKTNTKLSLVLIFCIYLNTYFWPYKQIQKSFNQIWTCCCISYHSQKMKSSKLQLNTTRLKKIAHWIASLVTGSWSTINAYSQLLKDQELIDWPRPTEDLQRCENLSVKYSFSKFCWNGKWKMKSEATGLNPGSQALSTLLYHAWIRNLKWYLKGWERWSLE